MKAATSDGAILVTGATGFIGRHITRRLCQAGRAVIALARGRGAMSARERLENVVKIAADGRALEVIDGDLEQPDAGLDSSRLARLRARVETVINCAGDTSFFPEAAAASRAVLIDGPLALLESLRPGRLRRWLHVSTAYVCGQRSGTVFEHEIDVGQSFHNPYEELKLRAEKALRGRCDRLGVDMRIVRPSAVVGPLSSTQGGSPSNLLFQFIRLMVTLGSRPNNAGLDLRIAGRPSADFNIVPVDYLSAAIQALMDHPEAAGGTFHIVLAEPPSQEAVLQAIRCRAGLERLRLIDGRCEALAKPSPLEAKVARMLAPYRDYLEQDVRFDDTGARRLLHSVGVSRSKSSAETIDRLIDMALCQHSCNGDVLCRSSHAKPYSARSCESLPWKE